MGDAPERRRSFDAAVEAYDSIRPTYPPAMLDALFGLLPAEPHIVEVGPGTGQSTRDLLDRGAHVHAVEIGPAMADRLRSNLPSDRLEITVGDFESVELPLGSADAVYSSTAYHWIREPAHVDRPAEVLRSGGVVAIVDLVQVNDPVDRGFFTTAQPIYDRYGQGTPIGYHSPSRDAVDPPMRAALAADDRFRDVELREYDWDQTYTSAEYRTLMESYSGTQMMEPGEREGLLDDIQQLVDDEFDGSIVRPVVVALTTAVRVVPRTT